jgi:iron complex transport system permease protein
MKTIYLIILLVVFSIVSVFVGNIEISLSDVLSWNPEKIEILTLTRFPRLAAIILTGAGMSICGLILQHISRNKFVSPTTGASVNSANFGLLVATIFFSAYGYLASLVFSAAFALIGTFTFISILRKVQVRNVVLVPLLGIMLGGLIESMATFLAYRYNMIESLNAWQVGSFTWIVKGRFELLYLSIPLVILAFLYANKFTIAGLGEDFSTNLGLKYNQIVNLGLVIVSLVTAMVAIIVGAVPFLDLIVPNIVSLYKGDNLRKTIWDTALFGAVFLLVCDIFSRLIIFPYEIPIGLTVGVIGSATFLILLFRRRSVER